jgi:flagellin-like hook-associated protein FlgL
LEAATVTIDSILALAIACTVPLVTASVFVGAMKKSLEIHTQALDEVRKHLSDIPAIQKELVMLGSFIHAATNTLNKHSSLWPKLDSRLAVVEAKVQSVKDFQRVQSSHGWGNGEDK